MSGGGKSVPMAFDMGRVIGHGAFGVVRIARERQSGKLMAIKQLRKGRVS